MLLRRCVLRLGSWDTSRIVHFALAAAATGLFDANVDEQLIKMKTGHSSDAVRCYKRVSDSKLESLSDVVACKPDAACKVVKLDNDDVDFQQSSSASASAATAAVKFSSCIFNGSVIVNLNDRSA